MILIRINREVLDFFDFAKVTNISDLVKGKLRFKIIAVLVTRSEVITVINFEYANKLTMRQLNIALVMMVFKII